MMAAASSSEWMKSSKLDVDPNSAKATKHFKYWLKTFTNFVTRCLAAPRADGVPEPDKLEILCAYISADVYELIEGLDSNDAAIAKLKASFIKTPNVIFSRHQFATRKQKAGESLEEFLQALHVMSKDCNLRNVSAEEYCLDPVRNAFINGLASHHIRQRLLKSKELTVDQAFNKARSLFQAQEYSATYLSSMSGTNSVAASSTRTEDNSENEADINLSPVTSGEVLAVATFSGGRKCYYCGQRYHCRADCLVKEVSCNSSGNMGDFSCVCRFKGTKPTKKPSVGQTSALSSQNPSPLFTTYEAACSGSSIKASLGVSVNGIKLTALVDSGSSESYTNSDTSKKLGLKPISSNHNVQMASAAMKMRSFGFCVVDMTINGKKYEATRLNVLDNLCSNIYNSWSGFSESTS